MENFKDCFEDFAQFYYTNFATSSDPAFKDLPIDTEEYHFSYWHAFGKNYAIDLNSMERLTANYFRKDTDVVALSEISGIYAPSEINVIYAHLHRLASRYSGIFNGNLLRYLRFVDIILRFTPVRRFTMFFGFRQYGVDDTAAVVRHLQANGQYRALYRLDIDKDKETAVLTKLSPKTK